MGAASCARSGPAKPTPRHSTPGLREHWRRTSVRVDDTMTSQAKPRLILLLGGARSGKSAYGERLATQLGGKAPVLYIATATASDDEMRQRIARHQASRPPHWLTLEEPYNPASALHATTAPVALLDCVTLLVANLLLANTNDPNNPVEMDFVSGVAEES